MTVEALQCMYCGMMLRGRADARMHDKQCAYRENMPPHPVNKQVSSAEQEQTREDLVDLLRELED